MIAQGIEMVSLVVKHPIKYKAFQDKKEEAQNCFSVKRQKLQLTHFQRYFRYKSRYQNSRAWVNQASFCLLMLSLISLDCRTLLWTLRTTFIAWHFFQNLWPQNWIHFYRLPVYILEDTRGDFVSRVYEFLGFKTSFLCIQFPLDTEIEEYVNPCDDGIHGMQNVWQHLPLFGGDWFVQHIFGLAYSVSCWTCDPEFPRILNLRFRSRDSFVVVVMEYWTFFSCLEYRLPDYFWSRLHVWRIMPHGSHVLTRSFRTNFLDKLSESDVTSLEVFAGVTSLSSLEWLTRYVSVFHSLLSLIS